MFLSFALFALFVFLTVPNAGLLQVAKANGIISTESPDFGEIPRPYVVIEGDSISTAKSSAKWPYYLSSLSPYFKSAFVKNFATSGERTFQMLDEYETQAHTTRPKLTGDNDYWFFLYAGINDFSSYQLRDPWLVYWNLKTIWAKARMDGYKVVAFTLFYSTSFNQNIIDPKIDFLNHLIKSDPSLYDYLIDTANVLNPRTESTDFSDGTHPNAQGAKKIVDEIAKIIKKTIIFNNDSE